MKILVTGAAGLLGANLILAATERKIEATAALHSHRALFPNVDHISLNLNDIERIDEIHASLCADWIVHCAAYTDVDWCETHPAEVAHLHVEATRRLASLAARANQGFLYISTDSVFRGDRGYYGEDDAVSPQSVYSRTKEEGERVVLAHPRGLVARVNLFGWNLRDKTSLGEWVLRRLQTGQDVPGFLDVHFNPLLASDLANYLLDLIERDSRGLFHVAGAETCTKYHFAQQVADAFGFNPARVRPVLLASAGLRAHRPQNSSLDVTKLARTLNCQLPGLHASITRFRETQTNGYLAQLKSCFVV